MTNLLQSLEAETQPQETNVDYVAWATEKFRNADGTLDVAALARGKWESDVAFVPKLTKELQEARKEAQTRASLEDFIEDYRSQSRNVETNKPVINPAENLTQHSSPALTQEDIDRIVEAKLTTKQRELIAQSNLNTVTSTLKEKWGDQAKMKLEAKARSLDMSVEDLTSMAQRAPKAFLELVLDKAPATPPPAPTVHTPPRNQTQANISQINTSGAKTRKQWNDMRRKMSASEYWTPEVQEQILADKIALGDKFDL